MDTEQLKREKNKTKAFELRFKGFSFSQIAAELNVSKSTARNWVNEAQKDYLIDNRQQLEVLRNDQLAALDDLIRHNYLDLQQAEDVIGDDGKLYRDGIKSRSIITQTILKLLQEKSKLLGLYAPTVVEQIISNSTTEGEIKAKVDYSTLSEEELNNLFADKLR